MGGISECRVDVLPDGDCVVLAPVGDVGLSDRLLEAITYVRGSGFDDVVVDLRATAVDLATLRMLAKEHVRAVERGQRFAILYGPASAKPPLERLEHSLKQAGGRQGPQPPTLIENAGVGQH